MVRGKPLSADIRQLIITKHLAGKSYRIIAAEVNRTHSTIRSFVTKYKRTNSLIPGKRTGRKRVTTDADSRSLKRIVKNNRRRSVAEINTEWNASIGKSVSANTCRRNIHRLGYKFCSTKAKPFLTKRQVANRLQWAKRYAKWSPRQWDDIIWSDECRFEISMGSGRKRVLRTKNEAFHPACIRRTTKFAASVMVWGCMSSTGMGELRFIDGTLNAAKYQDLLADVLEPSIRKLRRQNSMVFQQDGAPAHTAKTTKRWLIEHHVETLPGWPASSPDLSPIENIWGIMKRDLKKNPAKSTDHLRKRISALWRKISVQTCCNLVHSMPKRLTAVIKAKGQVCQY